MPGFCPPQDYVFFADEAGISNDRFTVVGGLCVLSSSIPALHSNIDAYRHEHNMHSELKWSKVSNQKLEQYRALVELFFAMNNSNVFHFHAIVFDSHQVDFKRIPEGGHDSDKVLSRLYYQLVVHKFAKLYPNDSGMCVCLDRRNSSTPLEDLKRMINATLARDHGIAHSPVKQLVSQDSCDDDMLQLNDVILGAVCAARNGKHLLADYRQSKRELAALVLEKSGLKSFEYDSPRGVQRFTMWNFRSGNR